MKKHIGDYNNDVPTRFECIYTKVPSCQDMVVGYLSPTSNLSVKKESANPEITNGNNCYSFEGAVFTVYDGKDEVGTLTAKANGTTNAINLEEGTYRLVETSAPKGYSNKDGKGNLLEQTITLTAGVDKVVTFKDVPTTDPVGILLHKVDKETGQAVPQGDGSLKNAEYTVKYYGVDKESDIASATPIRTWVLNTDEDGYCQLDKAYYVSGDDFFLAANGDPTLPIGWVTITETKAPSGYIKDDTVYNVQIKDDGSHAQSINTYNAKTTPEPVIRGGVAIRKVDKETKDSYPQGSATLIGTKFEITNISDNAVLVDGKSYAKGEIVKTIEVKTADGWAKTEKDTLPYGTYSIKEVAVGDGYLLTDSTPKTFTIREDQKYYTFENAVENNVKRGDVKLVKVKDNTLQRLKNVPFRITSKTTGESHIIVTNDNGQASTASSWNLHSNNTNQGKTSDDGVWFGIDENGKTAKLDDTRGALPYDTYILDELPCEANEGLVLVKGLEFKIDSDVEKSPERGYVNLGTVTNDLLPPTLGTTATDSETKGHVSCADSDVTIIDKVDMKNLIVGRAYTVKGTLIDKATGKAVTVDGKPVTAEKPFVALAQNMSIDMEFTFDGSDMKGKDVVVYEHLYQYGIEIAEHADINDEGQTITFPEIGTTAVDSETGGHIANADKEVAIIDTVKFNKLTIGKEYTVTGTLMDKATGKELLVGGKPVTQTKTFTPEAESGSVDIEFTFDGSALKGKTVVVFENVQTEGIDIAIHTDINDEGQSVNFPEVGTKAVKVDKGIVDTVKYENLVIGQAYKVSGILMDKATGQPLLVDGKEVTGSVEFVAERESGQLDVRFDVDPAKLEGKTVVVFEELTLDGKVVGEHKDINDKDQTLEYPVPEKPTPKTPTPKTPTPKGPETGDTAPIGMYITILMATFATGTGLCAYRRKK